MNTLKITLATFLFSLLFFATSCDKSSDDVSCTAPALQQNIVGTWKADYEPTAAAFEFRSNGTLNDPDDAIIGGSVNGDVFTVKTYQTIGEDSLYVKAASATTTNFVDVTLPVKKNECDEITFEFFGVDGSITRQ